MRAPRRWSAVTVILLVEFARRVAVALGQSQVTDALLHWSVSHLRIAAINFLNPAPLMWDFEHEPGKSRLAERYSIHQTTPSACADELIGGAADIGLIPV